MSLPTAVNFTKHNLSGAVTASHIKPLLFMETDSLLPFLQVKTLDPDQD
jgi:hypothetical protein